MAGKTIRKKTRISGRFKGIFILVLIFTGIFLISFAKETYRNYKVNKEIKDLKSDIKLLKTENLELTSLIDYFKTDNFAEKEARIKLGMKKADEKVFVIKDDPSNKNTNSADENQNNKTSNLEKWWQYFFE